MLTHAMEHSHVAAPARGRLLGLRRQDRPTLRTCNTLAFRRCWPTATSCISSRRNILTEHVGWHQNNLCRRTFLTRTAATRCFIQASYSSGLPTQIIQVLGLKSTGEARAASNHRIRSDAATVSKAAAARHGRAFRVLVLSAY